MNLSEVRGTYKIEIGPNSKNDIKRVWELMKSMNEVMSLWTYYTEFFEPIEGTDKEIDGQFIAFGKSSYEVNLNWFNREPNVGEKGLLTEMVYDKFQDINDLTIILEWEEVETGGWFCQYNKTAMLVFTNGYPEVFANTNGKYAHLTKDVLRKTRFFNDVEVEYAHLFYNQDTGEPLFTNFDDLDERDKVKEVYYFIHNEKLYNEINNLLDQVDKPSTESYEEFIKNPENRKLLYSLMNFVKQKIINKKNKELFGGK